METSFFGEGPRPRSFLPAYRSPDYRRRRNTADASGTIAMTHAFQRSEEGDNAGSKQPMSYVFRLSLPYWRTCALSMVMRPLDIMPPITGKKLSIFSCESTISTMTGRSCEKRRILVV